MVMKIMNMQIPAMPGSICPFALTRSSMSVMVVTEVRELQGVQVGEQVRAFFRGHGASHGGHHGTAVEDGIHDAVVLRGCAAVEILLLEDAAERLAVQRLVGAVVMALR